jgi:hypothetical protein
MDGENEKGSSESVDAAYFRKRLVGPSCIIQGDRGPTRNGDPRLRLLLMVLHLWRTVLRGRLHQKNINWSDHEKIGGALLLV